MQIERSPARPAALGGEPVRRAPYPRWPQGDQRELELLREVVSGERWFSGARGDDPDSLGVRFAAAFAALHNAPHGVAVVNGSVAIEIALLALGVGPGDEVIVPPYTFLSTATSVLRVGAVPVFADIEEDTYCLDPAVVERRLTSRTSAILPVHFGGQMADVERLTHLADDRGLALVEDCAQAIGARRLGRAAGTWGAAGTFSFQSNKTITAGEGGLVLTGDAALAHELVAYAAFGRYGGATAGRSSAVLSYRLATNSRLSELQSAVLLAQLQRFPEQDARRQANAAFLTDALDSIPGVLHVGRLDPASHHGYYYFVVRYQPEAFADLSPTALCAVLNAEGIPFVPGDAIPVYRHPVFAGAELPAEQREHFRSVFDPDDPGCPVAEEACGCTLILRHPLLLAEREDIQDVATALARAQAWAGALAASLNEEG